MLGNIWRLLALVVLITSSSAVALAWQECLVLTTDFSNFGSVCSLDRTSPWYIDQDLTTVSGDPIARYHDGLYYVVNRGGASNLQVIDPASGYATVDQFSLGAGNNPQDIAFAPDGTAYVSCYDQAVLLHVNVTTGAVLGSVSTADFADADGLPETGWMQTVGSLLYVSCQRLDRGNYYLPVGDSYLLVFDMDSGTWLDVVPGTPQIDGIALTVANPYTRLVLSPDASTILVGCNGIYGLLDGGVERIDLASRSSLGLEISESALGGDVLDVTWVSEQSRYVIASNTSFQTSVRHYVPGTSNVTLVAQAGGYYHTRVLFDGDSQVFVTDRTPGAAGIRIYAASTGGELTTSPLATGLPPLSVALPVASGHTPVPPSVPRSLTLGAPWPNPCNPAATVEINTEAGALCRVGIYDLAGRQVRSDLVTTDTNGTGRYHFDGLDRAGRALPASTYQIVVRNENHLASTKLTLVK